MNIVTFKSLLSCIFKSVNINFEILQQISKLSQIFKAVLLSVRNLLPEVNKSSATHEQRLTHFRSLVF